MVVLRPLLAAGVPVLALAMLGGAYSSSVLPLLAAATAAFILSQAKVAADPHFRWLDLSLVGLLLGMGLQLVPLPRDMVTSLSPHALVVRDLLTLDVGAVTGTVSIRPTVTRETLASAVSVVLLFWAVRSVSSQGGVRLAARTIAVSGFVAALVGLAQRATAPMLLLWTWTPLDPGARPFGPFVNRNHFALWLLMAGSLTVGAAIAHAQTHGLLRRPTVRQRLFDILADGTALMLTGAAGLMWLTLIASTSRGALLGLTASAGVCLIAATRRVRSRATLSIMALSLAGLVAWGVWANIEGIAGRFAEGVGDVRREAVWRETLPIIRDFPLTGTGAGTFADAMLHYQQAERRVLFNEAHSEYLQIVSEGGVLLMLPALLALAAWIRLAYRALQERESGTVWIRVGAVAGIAGAAVVCIWDSALRMPANAMLFALLAAIAIYDRRPDASRRTRVRFDQEAPPI